MEIKVSEAIGFCHGVKRAVELSRKALASGKGDVFSVGPLIHNPQVVDELLGLGLTPIDDAKTVTRGTVIISSHGAGALLKETKRRGLRVIDATCPFVSKIQEKIKRLRAEGYKIVIVGKMEHPEVKGLVEVAKGEAMVIKDEDEALRADLGGAKVGVVSQSTYSKGAFLSVVSVLLTRPFAEMRVFDTICRDTLKRQDAARRLADTVDAVVVIGGSNSANTKRLLEICSRKGKTAYHVEKGEDIRPAWLNGKRCIGVVSGASTPDEAVRDIIKKISSYAELIEI